MGRYRFKTVTKLNPASLLLEPDSAVLMHDCAEIIDDVYSRRIDLRESNMYLEGKRSINLQ